MQAKHWVWALGVILVAGAVGLLLLPGIRSVEAGPVQVPGEHYKCYPINPPIPVDIPVGLRDQFGPSNARVLEAIELCTPVDKNGEGILNPEVHLVCYTIWDSNQNRHHVQTWNQFHDLDFIADPARKLCVPSFKEHLYSIRPDGTIVFPGDPTGG